MKIEEIIDLINSLNRGGARFATAGDYGCATSAHTAALNIFTKNKNELNSDYEAVSRAGIAYAHRQQTEWNEAFRELDESWAHVKDNTTSFGQARVLEERGLVHSYRGPNDSGDLEEALQIEERAIALYKRALQNDDEIVTPDDIENRLLRVYGVAAITANKLSKFKNRATHLTKALEYSSTEVTQRETRGEKKGNRLSNAYHNLGVIKSEIVVDNPGVYEEAKENLIRAQELSTRPMVQSVISVKLAWLEYQAFPDNKKRIGNFVKESLDRKGKKAEVTWNAAVKNAMLPQFITLNNHLGDETINSELQHLYKE